MQPRCICLARFWAQSYVNRLKHTHVLLCLNTCAGTHILTSRQCIIIPKQTVINEPYNAYLSERRQLPPPLPLGWGCYSDRFIDIWREREVKGSWVVGVGLHGWGGGGDTRQGDGYQFEDVGALPFAFVFVFHLSISCPCQSVLGERTVHELFFNHVSVRRHLGCISCWKRLILNKQSMYKPLVCTVQGKCVVINSFGRLC